MLTSGMTDAFRSSRITYSCSRACREQGSLLETWIVMEYADRGNLADALRSGRFPSHDFIAVYRCLLDIAAGVACRSSCVQCSWLPITGASM